MSAEDHIFGKYKLIHVLGEGAAGTVFLAQDIETGQPIALKVMHQHFQLDETMLKRFTREAQNSARLQHPNILHVYDTGCIEDKHYIATEYIQGKDLKEVILARKRLPVGAVLGIACRMASALQCANDAGIIHRDIKPHNIFVGVDGEVKLGDFGLARQEDGSDMVTMAQTPLGTPAYMPREQILCEAIDVRADIYSLGATLYDALTGHPPFADASNLTELLLAQVHQQPPPLPEETEKRCSNLSKLIMRMMEKSPEDRPASPDELLTSLEICKQEYSESADPNTATLVQMTKPKDPTLLLNIARPNKEPEGREITITDTVTIGRNNENDVPVHDSRISRRNHARIEIRGSDLFLVQNQEKAKIQLNGEDLPGQGAPLQVGDEIRIGDSTITIEAGEVATEDEVEDTITRLVAEAEAIDYGSLAKAKRKEKEDLLNAARQHYDASRPWQARLGKLLRRGEGRGTMMMRRYLVEQGHSEEESNRLVQEIKGNRADHLLPDDVLRERSDFCGMMISDDEITLVIHSEVYKERLKGYKWGEIIRYRGEDWYPVKKRQVEENLFLYLKKCT